MLSNHDLMRVTQTAFDILDEMGEEADASKVFYAIRGKLQRVDGFEKKPFLDEQFPKIKEQWQKPLSKAGRALMKEEFRLREALVAALYSVDSADDPDLTRKLLTLSMDLKGDSDFKLLNAIKEAQQYASDELKAECLECWPEDLRDD